MKFDQGQCDHVSNCTALQAISTPSRCRVAQATHTQTRWTRHLGGGSSASVEKSTRMRRSTVARAEHLARTEPLDG
eukprot:5816205-Pleurochrysis_carterae.AAC.1